MLRRLCTVSGNLTATEAAAVEQLCSSHRQLLMEAGITDVRSEAGYAACANFLADVDRTARSMGLPTASRAYRRSFSANYRALFPDNARLYRVDVLETSLDQHSEIWVNGENFELSPEAMGFATSLQKAWADVVRVVGRWRAAAAEEISARPGRAELAAALVALDVSWAHFESKYIGELIAIEEKARQLIVNAASLEQKLRAAPEHLMMDGARREVEKELVKCIAHINSVANFKCKGRDDLGYDILASAKRVVREVEVDRVRFGEERAEARAAAHLLASEVIASYEAMGDYLRQASACMERVDPHLCNNPGLVARLVDWETSWEIGAKYVRDVQLMDAICDVVSEVRSAQQLAPAFTQMCEDCDVELFLVLPRFVMLLFAASRGGKRASLVRSLLPHRFADATDGERSRLDDELIALCEHFERLVGDVVERHPDGKAGAWPVLVKRAIKGDSGAADERSGKEGKSIHRSIEDFMMALERWSLELQRHCPQDWNQCSAVLVQCITGTMTRMPTGKFQI